MKFVNLSAVRRSDSRWRDANAQLTISPVNHHPNRLGSEMYSTLIRESLQDLAVIPAPRGTTERRVDGSDRED